MAKFIFNKNIVRFIITPEVQQIVVTERGTEVVRTPARTLEIKGGELVTEDKEIIDRIRKDSKFGTEEIRELTLEDQRIIAIRIKKEKEAEKEIAELKSK